MMAVIAVVVVGIGGVVGYYVLVPRGGPEIVRVDGSSTVFPITSAWAASFNSASQQVVVAFSGTGGGFAKFCRGETDLSDASRPIRASETETCTTNGIAGIVEYLIAYDGLSVVVHPSNTWVDHLSVADLCRIWTSNESAGACDGDGGRATTWNQLNPAWPTSAIDLYGPGTDSGTFDYFVEVILDPTGDPITDLYFGSLAPGGYAWVIPKDGCANVGLGAWQHFDGNLGALFRKFLAKHGWPEARGTGGHVPVVGPVDRTVKPPVLLVGDAAGHVMATNGGGINVSMIAGRIAGNTAADHVLDGTPLDAYERRWRDSVGGPLAQGARIKKIADRFFGSDPLLEAAMLLMGRKRMRRAIQCQPLFLSPPRGMVRSPGQ